MGGINNMADDRMKKDDQRNMGTKDREEFGQQTPGRSGSGEQGGQRAGSQPGGQFGNEKGSRNLDEDDDIDTGGKSKGGQNRGGQNR
jgi:hypothetical protein